MSAGNKYWGGSKEGEGDRESLGDGVQLAVFNSLAREGFTNHVTFVRDWKEVRGTSCMAMEEEQHRREQSSCVEIPVAHPRI